jgi:hypothetical protein
MTFGGHLRNLLERLRLKDVCPCLHRSISVRSLIRDYSCRRYLGFLVVVDFSEPPLPWYLRRLDAFLAVADPACFFTVRDSFGSMTSRERSEAREVSCTLLLTGFLACQKLLTRFNPSTWAVAGGSTSVQLHQILCTY